MLTWVGIWPEEYKKWIRYDRYPA